MVISQVPLALHYLQLMQTGVQDIKSHLEILLEQQLRSVFTFYDCKIWLVKAVGKLQQGIRVRSILELGFNRVQFEN